MDRFIRKDTPWILARYTSFYAVNAPEEIPDKFFDVAHAIEVLNIDLQKADDIGDVLRRDQIDVITSAYARFLDNVGAQADDLQRKLKGLQMENGRLRAKIRKLEGNDDE